LEKSRSSDSKVLKRKIADLQDELGHSRSGYPQLTPRDETKSKMERIEGKKKLHATATTKQRK
jgi:hypothetical protein